MKTTTQQCFKSAYDLYLWQSANCEQCKKSVCYNQKLKRMPQYRCAVQQQIEGQQMGENEVNQRTFDAVQGKKCQFFAPKVEQVEILDFSKGESICRDEAPQEPKEQATPTQPPTTPQEQPKATVHDATLLRMSMEKNIPIEELDLRAGTYTLEATTEGTGESSVIMRVIDKIPSNDDSLGQRYLTLEDDGEASFTTTLLAFQRFNYIWMRIPQGSNVNFTLTVSVYDENFSSVEVFNRGNVFSKPKITIHGSGTINLTRS